MSPLMGDPSRSERILGPGTEAIAYGLAAMANTLAQVLAEPVVPVKNIDDIAYVDLVLRARQAADDAANDKSHYVARARVLWQQLKASDPSLASVSILDLAVETRKPHASSQRSLPLGICSPPITPRGRNRARSSVWLRAYSQLKVQPKDEVAKILLRHEAKHVAQFRDTNHDQPPASYHAMAFFELQAYSQTHTELVNLEAEHPDWRDSLAPYKEGIKGLVDFFSGQLQKNTDSAAGNKAIRDAMVASEMLPKSADVSPSNLYLP